MEIFISWSGQRSKLMAIALKEWLPLVLDSAEPWMSSKDINAGDRWSVEIGKRLEIAHFGIICLTKDNLNVDWILYEAGAISKAFSDAAVCPYLLDVDYKDITGPLSQFQSKKADQESTLQLVEAINSKSSDPVDNGRIAKRFTGLWPQLEEQLKSIPALSDPIMEPVRRESDILEDIVRTMRGLESRLDQLQQFADQVQPLLDDIHSLSKIQAMYSQYPFLRGMSFFQDVQTTPRGPQEEQPLRAVSAIEPMRLKDLATEWPPSVWAGYDPEKTPISPDPHSAIVEEALVQGGSIRLVVTDRGQTFRASIKLKNPINSLRVSASLALASGTTLQEIGERMI